VLQVPGLLEAIRTRLDRAEQDAKAAYLDRLAGNPPDPPSSRFPKDRLPAAFEEAYVRDLLPRAFPDPLHDDLLVAYWRLNGRLNEIEAARCRRFGYACPPMERLEELLGERR
jgi:hypothetical protein